MPEPLNAFESLEMSATAPSVISAVEAHERWRQAPAVGAYVWPSACDRCVPVRQITEDSYFLTVSEASHEPGCPNHPCKHIQSLPKESAW